MTAAERRRLEASIERAAKYEVARLVALLLRRLSQPPTTIASTTKEPLDMVTSVLGEKLQELRAELDIGEDDLAPELDTGPRESRAVDE